MLADVGGGKLGVVLDSPGAVTRNSGIPVVLVKWPVPAPRPLKLPPTDTDPLLAVTVADILTWYQIGIFTNELKFTPNPIV